MNDVGDNIFSNLCVSYLANERIKEDEQFHCKNYLLEMSYSHAKMGLKIAPQKLDFIIAKATSKNYTM